MPKDTGAAGFLFLVGLITTVGAHQLALGRPGSPGPGFFPFFLALALSIVSLVLLVRSLAVTRGQENDSHPGKSLRRRRVVWTLLLLLGYSFGLEPLGFLLATFLLMLFLYRVVGPQRWEVAMGGAFVTVVAAYALFRLLQVRLPAGLWAP